MRLQESGEMYLETIHVLSKKSRCVRSIDVAEHMGYSKPSVSRAVGILKKGGYVETDENGFLTLTDTGRAIAEKTYERHQLLTELFVRLAPGENLDFPDGHDDKTHFNAYGANEICRLVVREMRQHPVCASFLKDEDE